MAGDSSRESAGLRRQVLQTTIAPETAQFLKDHPEYAAGRLLDIAVDGHRAKDLEERVKRLTIEMEAFEVGGCACGRILRIRETKAGPPGRCPGCNLPPSTCGCEPTIELAQRRLLDWQRIRTEAGLETTNEDIAAKKVDLGIVNPERDEAFRRKEREASRKRNEESLQAGSEWHKGPAIVRPAEPK